MAYFNQLHRVGSGHNGPALFANLHHIEMVHSLFLKSGSIMSYISFTRIWTKACADIVIMKPREDECGKCSDLQSQISRALTELDRITLTDALRPRLTGVFPLPRGHYRAATTARPLARQRLKRGAV